MSKTATKPLPELVSPDLAQCQADKPNPAYGIFKFGGSTQKLIRCTEKPVVIAREKQPGKDGRHGSMSLCLGCMCACVSQTPDLVEFTPIAG